MTGGKVVVGGGTSTDVGGRLAPLASDRSRAVETALVLSRFLSASVDSAPARGSLCVELLRWLLALDRADTSSLPVAEESLDLDRS